MSLPFAGPDRLLAHFQRTGDPRALGRLFDRTAPELLRIACWLAGNRADAEDLLQRTFLTVLTSRGAYDAGRRALPWLCGILGNHARKLHEQRARPPLSALPAAARDPVAAAADAELADTVARLRGEIGSPYAEVLDLHLAEGLDAKSIAARLGRPAGTVRTQLVRALRRLRALLPGGFVAGAALTANANAQAASLAAVRASLLRAAGAPGIPATVATATALGGLVMAKKALLFAPLLALVAGGGAWLALRDGETGAPAPARGAVPVAAALDPVAGAADRAPTAARETIAARQAVPPTVGVAADPDSATIVVRAKWADDGSPAAAVGFTVMPQPRNVVHQRHALTGDDGVAVLRGVAPGTCWVGSAFSKLASPDVRAGTVHEIDVLAERDFVLEGTVVDAHERPVADARLWLSDTGSSFRGHEVGRSDERGAFRLAVKSHQHVGARKAGHAPSRLRLLTGKGPVVLVLAGEGGSVRGRVVDEQGRPIAAALVELGWPGGFNITGNTREVHQVHPTAPTLRTDADGAFVHDGVAVGNTDVRAWAAGHAPVSTSVAVEADRTAEVTVVLPRGGAVTGVVRDGTGAAIADASVGLAGATREFGVSSTRTDADGRYRLEDLPVGRVSLVARNKNDKANTSIELTASAPATWDPVLQSLATFAGRVVGPDGLPLEGLNVGIADGSQPLPSRLAVTDADGNFDLEGVEQQRRLHLMVLVDHEPIAERRDIARTAERTTITLEPTELPTASVRGRVVDERGEPIAGASFGVMLATSSFGTATNSAADGTFRRERLRAGRFRASVQATGHARRQLPALELKPHEHRDLGDVVLARAGTMEVTFVGNTELRNAQVKVVEEDGSDVGWFAAEGRVARGELPPGRYVAIAQLGDDTAGSVPLVVRREELTRATLVCAPAAKVAIECRFAAPRPTGIARVQVFDSGEQLVGAWSLHLDLQIRDRPTVVRERLLPGSFRVALTAEDGRTASVPLHVRDVASTPSVVVELPAR